MNIHFIAIGGAAMHNLAIALCKKGYNITGSDDEIFDPSKSRLEEHGLLPKEWGWFPEKINSELDAVILGMHAREDNPELLKAQEIGVKIYSFPEYLYEQTKNKKRVVIGGSHGKTSITSMIMHVLKRNNIKFDYMVGSMIEGFDTMAGLSDDTDLAIFEGDEYLSSPIDRRPKFHLYKPHIALLTGIAWDHINVFPTFDIYKEQFTIFAGMIPQDGCLVYFEEDENLQAIAEKYKNSTQLIPYTTLPYTVKSNKCYVNTGKEELALSIFGKHNLQNLNGARLICKQIGISDEDFFSAIKDFKGAAKRLQLIKENDSTSVYLDFAHSPSKLQATVKAVKDQYATRELVACMELHTFSSLNEDFLKEYEGTMADADTAFVYFSPKAIEHKKLKSITVEQVVNAFGKGNITVFNDSEKLQKAIKDINWINKNLLLMSSGNFSGINANDLADELLK